MSCTGDKCAMGLDPIHPETCLYVAYCPLATCVPLNVFFEECPKMMDDLIDSRIMLNLMSIGSVYHVCGREGLRDLEKNYISVKEKANG